MGALHRRIDSKWKAIDGHVCKDGSLVSWGNSLDVRYHLCWKVSQLRSARVLDLGCGHGVVLSEVPGAFNTKIGVDSSLSALRVASQWNPEASFVRSDLRQPLPFRTGSFDAVILANVIEVLEWEPRLLIQEASRILKKAGMLFLTTPNGESPAYRSKQKRTAAELRSLLDPFFDFHFRSYHSLFWLRGRRFLAYLPGLEHLLACMMRVLRSRGGDAFFVLGRKKRLLSEECHRKVTQPEAVASR